MVKTGDYMKSILFIGVVILSIFFYIGNSIATDPPHSDLSVPSVNCSDCHTLHAAPGTSLTIGADNYNLCYSCHKPGGFANNLRIDSTEQATPGTSGRHHRWDRSIAAGVAPLNLTAGDAGNIYGLRTASELSGTDLKLRLQKYDNKIVCSVCHDQHSQTLNPWDPYASSTPGTSGRHFQRTANDLNQLCEDCHYYRVQTHTTVEGPGDGIKVFSHPVGQALNANVKGYDRAAPLDVNGAAQSGARFAVSGAGDTNDTNNLVVEGTTNKVRCLSCHSVHYTDSNGFTVDGSP